MFWLSNFTQRIKDHSSVLSKLVLDWCYPNLFTQYGLPMLIPFVANKLVHPDSFMYKTYDSPPPNTLSAFSFHSRQPLTLTEKKVTKSNQSHICQCPNIKAYLVKPDQVFYSTCISLLPIFFKNLTLIYFIRESSSWSYMWQDSKTEDTDPGCLVSARPDTATDL